MADVLPELVLEGWRDGPYGPGFDPAVFATFHYSQPAPPDSSFFSGGQGSETFEESFVAPVAPPVLQPPPAAVPPAAAPIAEIIVNAVRPLAPVVGLLAPSVIAPEPNPEALVPFDFSPFVPQEPEPLPELIVTGTRPPTPPPVFDDAFDMYEPPNWRDLFKDYRFYPWGNPIYGVELPGSAGVDLDADIERRRDVAPGAPRSDPAPSEPRRTAAPRRSPGIGVVGSPAPDLLGSPFEDPFGLPYGSPAPSTRPAPRTDVKPDIGFPLGDPFTDPVTFAPPRTAPAPSSPRAPSPSFDPFDPMQPDPEAQPDPTHSGCDCTKQKPETKQRKKKQPRRRCYRGTYVEKSSSLSKSPKEEIPCQ